MPSQALMEMLSKPALRPCRAHRAGPTRARMMNRNRADFPRRELLEVLRSSPIDLQLASEIIGHDAPLMEAISGLESFANRSLAVSIVSIGVEPLLQLISTLPDAPNQVERSIS